ncbi:MAG: LytTR family DNA-binding domain-containing protein [Treponema sp.]|nr:LytTR family DNA-binding domain-containing protein [Treponema sp.]
MVEWAMFKIAVCDDEVKIAAALERDLGDILDALKTAREITVFHSAADMCRALEGGARFDLIFLDINFAENEINGVEAARIIRGEGDDRTSIVYISWENRRAAELSKTRPIEYLLKPLELKAVEDVVKTFLRLAALTAEALFHYRKNGNGLSARIRDIVYFESRKRKIIMHLRGGREEEFYGTLKEIREGQLKGRDFLFAHASYLVNYDYVRAINYKGMLVAGREAPLPISQDKRSEVREQYLEITDRRSGA